jgi:anaerobic magnesium-protoporphyrin IX monomethyl ester cyclase
VRVALVYVGRPEGEGAWAGAWTAPIGTTVLGTLARRRGHDVELFDTRIQDVDVVVAIDAFDPELIGFSFLSPDWEQARTLAASLRRPGRVLVAGGVHATVATAAVRDSHLFDTVVAGEGEHAFTEVLAMVGAGHPPPPVVHGALVRDLDVHGDRDWFDCYDHVYADDRPFRTYNVQTGRGCPMRCTFCEIGNHAHFPAPSADRFRSADSVLAEITRGRVERGVDYVVFVDSIFTTNLALATEIVRRLRVEHSDLPVQFNAHVNRFTRGFAVEAGRHGNASAWFGFESGSQRVLDLIQKDVPLSKQLDKARLCRDHGVAMGANILLGVPTETAAERDESVAFIESIDPDFPNPNIFNPLPGSVLHAHCEREGLLRDPEDLHIWLRDEIVERRDGPVIGVDYTDVVATFDELLPAPHPAGPDPWSLDSTI